MPKIRPISDLRNNFAEITKEVQLSNEPVFLTKNGRGRYAILDMEEYERTHAVLKLMKELAKGDLSGNENGWVDFSDVEKELGVING